MMQNMSTEWEFLILSNVYGPGEHVDYERSHFVGSLINKIKQSTCNIDMLGTGVAVRDFIYISDVAEIICKYCELNYATCAPTNISTGTGTDILTMTETLTTIANPQLNVQWGRAEDNGVLYKVLDNSKMIKDIEFTPQMKLNVGLKNTWNWFTNL
jgi:nucleoside-diphosphate-sugar epimerase